MIQKSLCIVPVIITIKRNIVIKGRNIVIKIKIRIVNTDGSKELGKDKACYDLIVKENTDGSKELGKYNIRNIKKNSIKNLRTENNKLKYLINDIFFISFIKYSSCSLALIFIKFLFIF